MGVDKISPRELKIGGESVVPGLQLVLNKIIESRTVPDRWKIARLKSAFKKGPKDETENYRPLSMLSIPSKILEGQICRPLNNHLDIHELSTPAKWGFKEGKSIESLLLHMTEDWRKALDRKKVIGILFIDFRKAFDSVNHIILKKKLQVCGISGQLFELLESYLGNRSQFVELNGAYSNSKEISYGVPHGSLLGPKLFSLYINDLPENISKGQVYIFADDTTFYYVGQNTEVIDALNVIGNDVSDWCQKNKLSIHSGKSEVLIMTAQDFVGPLKPVRIGEDIIDYVQSSKCLGITIANHLKWNLHINKLSKSYKAKVSQLRSMSYLPVKVKEEIYFKTIISSVTYGMAVWGTSSPALMTEIEKPHVRAARLIHNLPRNL